MKSYTVHSRKWRRSSTDQCNRHPCQLDAKLSCRDALKGSGHPITYRMSRKLLSTLFEAGKYLTAISSFEALESEELP